MTRKIFESDLEELHSELLRMGSMAEKQIYDCMEALEKQDETMAETIIKKDDIIDDMQKEIENKVIRLIAMQQPIVAEDLRNIFTTVKIITDLERLGDHAVDIAKAIKRLNGEKHHEIVKEIWNMGSKVKSMIKDSLDAYVERNLDKAYEVCKRDDEVDALYKRIFNELLDIMSEDKSKINQLTQFLFVCKYLERIGDRTTNVCESTIYLITGKQVDLND
ncbi:phosphate signaling complex protein PhoU [Clostridium felsineum]|uniref:Phosphate-specific transport system accessory protein PhoU n=1 Tax=Clostridium felsineum TaxID=36839 RepID=A0A1S8M9A8_9CLOT|nr:phosphate signaling complex protein PhoU [Clostridium felsineum]MCR3759290.1 phosphate signaling complex protein PhoU [Clostridium felsineum]URZ00827.1 Phosphate-specific transport system accessory protein PhoU [Clostridium felsineum]URZ06534.1 Phosphate-specific transport system accessory protein PhoU [Clostridium felsineum]URZ11569.1 Phosphate-specific transport system accessory protein PhoU [Clostridium felsineum]URZ16132.1 Phosphate-specific transport system accessory protein PhoU [Clos